MELEDKLIFSPQWFPNLFRACAEEGLNWKRMLAIALIKSDGEPSKREIDWDFIGECLGLDNPNFIPMYDEFERPSVDIIDRGTRWGLFQVLGQVAIDSGFTGNLSNLTSAGKGIKAGVKCMIDAHQNVSDAIRALRARGQYEEAQQLDTSLPFAAEHLAFGIDAEEMDAKLQEIEKALKPLMDM